jgi:transposase
LLCLKLTPRLPCVLELRRLLGISESGRQIIVPWSDRDVRYSVTCCTDLSNADGFVLSPPRRDSNTARDFLEYVITLVEFGTLSAGDFLFVDNASIHYAEEIRPVLVELLEAVQVRLIFLPTYSPELNPVECVFGEAKRWLRYRRGTGPFSQEIVKAFSSVQRSAVVNFYFKAIEAFDT